MTLPFNVDMGYDIIPITEGFVPTLIDKIVGVVVTPRVGPDQIDTSKMVKYVGRLEGYFYSQEETSWGFKLQGNGFRPIIEANEYFEVYAYLAKS